MKRRPIGFTRDAAKVSRWARRYGWVGLRPVGRLGWVVWR